MITNGTIGILQDRPLDFRKYSESGDLVPMDFDAVLEDMRLVRPDLDEEGVRQAAQHLIASVSSASLITAEKHRQASYQALGGSLYASAWVRGSSQGDREVTVRLEDGKVFSGRIDSIQERIARHSWPCAISEYGRTWMSRQAKLVFDGCPVAFLLTDFIVWPAKITPKDLCAILRSHGVTFITASANW